MTAAPLMRSSYAEHFSFQPHIDLSMSDFDRRLDRFGLKLDRLALFGHVARLSHTLPVNQVLRICTKARDGQRPSHSQEWKRACGRPPTTWIHQICRNMAVTVTEGGPAELQRIGHSGG